MFVVCGEALFDVFAAGDTATGLMMDARIGGSPFNVAVGLRRLGQPVAFLGGLSRGFLGERLLRALREEGVDERCLALLEAPTTLSLIGVDEAGVPSYSFYGAGCADRLLPLSALDRLPPETQAIQFGSYAMVVDPTASTQRALVEREHGRRVIAYDPNVRLNVEPDLARWRDTLDWMAARTHLLKVSDEDLALLYPGVAHAELAARWRAAGVAMVVITRGGEGATGYHAQGEVPVAPVRVAVVDTVGAGDTFQAGMLTALAERGALSPDGLRALPAEVWAEVLAFAARAAAITCGRRGADLPRRHEVA
ncbi:carbohydrate kinase family protein [Ideonella livida]|uniref:Carbohydrate kinase n=1 Tax=Ideonella livida TaxID=2707176 RepID=A0A7C9TL48_9BURK|nr:carbohydrate kinase [Ideonella livida]NDY92978.1 carbohydrate kinase [Ideonella livida]